MDKILFENVLKLTDLHPSTQRRIESRRCRRSGKMAKKTTMEQRLWAERVSDISLEAGLVAVALP